MPPRAIRRTATITLEAGAVVPTELANNSTISASVQTVTYPSPQLFRRDVPGPKADYPVPGRLQPMTFVLDMTSVFASLMAGLGQNYSLEVEETLYTPNGVAVPILTTDVTGTLLQTNFNSVNLGDDAIRPVNFQYAVVKFKQIKGGIGEPIYDIDLDADIFKQNGKDMF